MEDDEKIWGIRGVPSDLRQAVIGHARKENIKVGEWLSLAIREKIKADRNQSKALVVAEAVSKNAVNLSDASSALDMLERLQGMGIEPSNTLKRQASSLVRKCIVNVRKGGSVQQDGDFV